MEEPSSLMPIPWLLLCSQVHYQFWTLGGREEKETIYVGKDIRGQEPVEARALVIELHVAVSLQTQVLGANLSQLWRGRKPS